MGCIFCDIASGRMDANKVFENETIVAFLDAFPVNAGHVLVVPKKHVRSIGELDDVLAGQLFNSSRRLATVLEKALGAYSTNIVTAPAAIEHFHIHVIPRYDYDLMGTIADLDNKRELSEEEMKETVTKIQQELSKLYKDTKA